MSRDVTRSAELYGAAEKLLPGGVNSPVRAFGSVGMKPLFIRQAYGSTITDVDGNSYIDYVGSWGPMILGHNHPDVHDAVCEAASHGLSFGAPCPAEVDLAGLMLDMVPGLEMVRMVNSGTEAVMSALRLARAATGRDKIIKFEGCYHGHADCMLVKAGSGAMTFGQPNSGGVPAPVAADTLLATYNDLGSVEALLQANDGQVAAIIVEPVAANMGVVPPQDGFLSGLRSLCDRYGSLLIFDEVITGFRLARGGAQEYFGVRADLATYGKIIGAGMPVGAYGGSRKLMELIAPLGPVYQAGTLSGNPVAMAAGYAQLSYLNSNPAVYAHIDRLAAMLADGFADMAAKNKLPLAVTRVGSLVCGFFTEDAVQDYSGASKCDTERFAGYFAHMLDSGIYIAPSQFEAMFIGYAHTQDDIEKTLKAAGSFK